MVFGYRVSLAKLDAIVGSGDKKLQAAVIRRIAAIADDNDLEQRLNDTTPAEIVAEIFAGKLSPTHASEYRWCLEPILDVVAERVKLDANAFSKNMTVLTVGGDRDHIPKAAKALALPGLAHEWSKPAAFAFPFGGGRKLPKVPWPMVVTFAAGARDALVKELTTFRITDGSEALAAAGWNEHDTDAGTVVSALVSMLRRIDVAPKLAKPRACVSKKLRENVLLVVVDGDQ